MCMKCISLQYPRVVKYPNVPLKVVCDLAFLSCVFDKVYDVLNAIISYLLVKVRFECGEL